MNFVPYVLAFLVVGVPTIIVGWVAYECWRVGKELDEDRDNE